jgi:uncharacterized protein YcfJ
MNKSLLIGLVAGAVVVTAGGAIALWERADYAEVTGVKPVMETVRTPREDCRDVTVTQQQPVKDERRIAGTAIGAVVGGIIGNQVGGGDGKKIATVAGAAGGGYAGSKIQKGMQERNTYTATERKCETVYDKSEKQVGYDVSYRLDGREGTVRMDRDPGGRIAVDKNGELILE